MNLNRIYPNNAITKTAELQGVSTFELEPDTSDVRTILSVQMKQSGLSSDTELLCGSDIIAKNYSSDLDQIFINYRCDKNIFINKTGAGDSSTIIVVYVNYDFALEEDFSFDGFHIFFGFITFFFIFFGLIRYFKNWKRS